MPLRTVLEIGGIPPISFPPLNIILDHQSPGLSPNLVSLVPEPVLPREEAEKLEELRLHGVVG
jgi:hypothetical protein